MDTKWIIGLVIVGLLGAGGLWFWITSFDPAATSANQNLQTYYHPQYGVAFNFPDTYELKQNEAAGARKIYSIVLSNKEDLANVPEAGEGPMSITLSIFPNEGREGLEDWIRTTNDSNFKLSQSDALATTTIAGMDALAYTWDGLYPSTSIVLNNKNNIYMFSVSFNATGDQIRKDFATVIASLQFDP